MDNSCTFQINIAGNVFAGVGTLQGGFNQLVQVVGHVDRSINTTFHNLQQQVKSISLNAVIDQVEKVANGIAEITKPGVGFEQSMADLSSITGIVGKDLKELSRVARQTGKESGLGAEQSAKAFALLASQIQVDKIGMEGLKNLQQNTITLSHAAGMSMDDAATALAGTINQFGLQATEADRVINVLAAGSKYGAAEIVDLSQSFKVVGAAANAAGLSVEDTAGAVEVLSKNNLKGAEAGTALRNIVLKLQTTLGVDFRKNSLSEALDALKPKLTDATYLSQVFGMENIAAAQFLIKNADAVAEMTAQVTGTNVAQEQAAIRTETTAQMMERCRARIDDLKISFFNLTGPAGGYAAILAEQAVTISQLIPLFSIFGHIIRTVTNLQKLQAAWTGIVSGAMTVWTGVQWLLNASLWACPITWIVAGIAALVAIIAVCATKVEGWGKQWDSIVNFMQAVWELFCESFKFRWNLLTNGILIGLDYIKLGWYKFKEAVGLGDSAENQAMINQIGASIEQRQQTIIDGAKKIDSLRKKAAGALTWELSWKKDEKQTPASGVTNTETSGGLTTPGIGTSGGSVLNPRKSGGSGPGAGHNSVLDLNKIVPNLKGSTAYEAIASRLSSVRLPAIAAAASLAMPLTVAATGLPQTAQSDPTPNEYTARRYSGKTVSVAKFCDKIEIHIAHADGKGYQQIENEVTGVLKQVLDNYEA